MPYSLRLAVVVALLTLTIAVLAALTPRGQEITLVEQSPVGSGVARDSAIRLTFSRPVDRASAEASFRLLPLAAGRFSWEGETLVFTPAQPLAAETTYNVTIRRGLRDRAGRSNRSETRWSFRTE
jgi:hypothetical protein